MAYQPPAPILVNAANSTTATLLANATFTGTSVDTTLSPIYSVTVTLVSDQASAVDGLQIQFSEDNSNWDAKSLDTYRASQVNTAITLGATIRARYFRVVYTNGTVNQTSFRLQTLVSTLTTTVAISGADGNPISTYLDSDGDSALAVATIQNITSDAGNHTTANLAAGATFTGVTTSILGVSAINNIFKCDQPCNVFVDQSGDGVNFDYISTYVYNPTKPFAITTKAVGDSYRIRVTNTGSATSTTLRLHTNLTPVSEPVPVSNDPYGNLKVGVNALADQYGNAGRYNSAYSLQTVEPFRLVGTVFGTAADTNFWTLANTGAGSAADIGSTTPFALTLTSGTANSGFASARTVRVARYIAANPNNFRADIKLASLTSADATSVRAWGAVTLSTTTPQDGAFFSVNGAGALSVNWVKSGGAIQSVASGSFNGQVSQVVLDTNIHVYEIIYRIMGIWFFVDGVLVHMMNTVSGQLFANPHLPATVWNANSGTGTTSSVVTCLTSEIMRLGTALTASTSKQLINTGNTVCKVGPGVIHTVLISAVVNGAIVNLYDNTTNTGTVIWTSGIITIANQSNNLPISLDFKDTPFFTGLTLEITTQNANVFITYE